jgi:hypothetical protein
VVGVLDVVVVVVAAAVVEVVLRISVRDIDVPAVIPGVIGTDELSPPPQAVAQSNRAVVSKSALVRFTPSSLSDRSETSSANSITWLVAFDK